MEITGDNTRFIGCNVKIIKAENFIGVWYDIDEIHKITGNTDHNFDWYLDNNEWSVSKDNCKLILDEDFAKKFKTEKIAIQTSSQKENDLLCEWLRNNTDDKYKNFIYYDWSEYYFHMEGEDLYSNLTEDKDDYTIIQFSDCCFEEEGYMKTNDFQEFVKYWKENDVYVEFDNIEDKKAFTINFDDCCQGSSYLRKYLVDWDQEGEEWVHTDTNKDNYKIIKFKDLKNWREILGIKKEFKVGDRVKLIGHGDYEILKSRIGIKGTIKAVYGKGEMFAVEFDINIKGHCCGGICKYGYGWNVHENQIEKIDEKPMKKYKLTGKYTLKNIREALPCEEEFDNFCRELIEDGWSYKDLFDNDITFTDDVLEFETVKNNIDWAIKEGFVEEEKEFEPFTFNVDINTKEELLTLLKHMNISSVDAEEINKEGGNAGYGEGYDCEFAHDTWKRLDDIYDEVVE